MLKFLNKIKFDVLLWLAKAGKLSLHSSFWRYRRFDGLSVAHGLCLFQRLPEGFYQWDIYDDEHDGTDALGNLSNFAATAGALPIDFNQWDKCNDKGYPVALSFLDNHKMIFILKNNKNDLAFLQSPELISEMKSKKFIHFEVNDIHHCTQSIINIINVININHEKCSYIKKNLIFSNIDYLLLRLNVICKVDLQEITFTLTEIDQMLPVLSEYMILLNNYCKGGKKELSSCVDCYVWLNDIKKELMTIEMDNYQLQENYCISEENFL